MNNKEKLGKNNINTFGTQMKIVEYYGAFNVIVEFQDEYKAKVHTQYDNFKKGKVKNPYDKIIFNVGYFGEGKYNRKKYKTVYNYWYDMLKRCYEPYYINKNLTYVDCFVEEYFHNFQNFAKWYEENYYEVNDEKMQLDKDILEKGNKIYNRKHMVFVPQRINLLFTKRDNDRGNTPIGTYKNKRGKIISQCCVYEKQNKRVYLGSFDNQIEAFNVYKQFKESYIKQIADEYRELIPQKLYDAMYNYKVEIND